VAGPVVRFTALVDDNFRDLPVGKRVNRGLRKNARRHEKGGQDSGERKGALHGRSSMRNE
jgi:hypothetical protein